jgi:translation initiation factor 5B
VLELKRELESYLQLEEKRRKKREKEKEKRDRDRADGKLLSKAEKSAQAKRASILGDVGHTAAGEDGEAEAEGAAAAAPRKRVVYDDRKKKKKPQQGDSAEAEAAAEAGTAAGATGEAAAEQQAAAAGGGAGAGGEQRAGDAAAPEGDWDALDMDARAAELAGGDESSEEEEEFRPAQREGMSSRLAAMAEEAKKSKVSPNPDPNTNLDPYLDRSPKP